MRKEIKMKINKFDVVELYDNNKATILKEKADNTFFAEIVNKEGTTIDKRDIISSDIKEVIYRNEIVR